jgi:hypothetical protein
MGSAIVYYYNNSACDDIADNYYKIDLVDGTRWFVIAQNGSNHAHIVVDINGKKPPNILGVDAFYFTIQKAPLNEANRHKIDAPGVYYFGHGIERSKMLECCKNEGFTCSALIVTDGDKITY